jgi:hypothetical protein
VLLLQLTIHLIAVHLVSSITHLYTLNAAATTPPTMPLRIAVLECDTPIGATKEKYGGYGNLFKELLHNGAQEVRDKDKVDVPELDVRKYDVVNEENYPEIGDVDAVLLSGSRELCPGYTLREGRDGMG